MPTKSLEEQLAEIEDAERRLRPLIAEAREAYQDLKGACRQAEEIVKHAAEAALKAEMGKLIEREMRDVVPDVAKFKADLRKEMEGIVGPVADLLDTVRDRYQAVADHYDALQAELEKRGYESTGMQDVIRIPVPANSKAAQEHRSHHEHRRKKP